MIVRELTGGVYFGEPKGSTISGTARSAPSTPKSTNLRDRAHFAVAFELARLRRNQVHSAEKRNVMKTGVLWNEVVTRCTRNATRTSTLHHILADNCAMQLVRAPKQFDVIVTDNLFGDMLSDEAAMLTGSLGMLPSASLGAADAMGAAGPSTSRCMARRRISPGKRHRQPHRHHRELRHVLCAIPSIWGRRRTE